jgi:adenylate cyclase
MLKEAVKQLGRRLLPMVFRPNPPVDRERTMEVARGLEKLIEPFVITGRTAEAYCAVFTVMNLAEDCGPSPELVRSFANMGLGLGLEGMHGAARAYIKLAGDVLAAAEDAPTRVYVGLMAGVYHTGIGDWKQAGSLLQMALELAESLGDARRATDVLTALVPSLIMQDRMQEAVALSDRLVVLGRSSVYSRNLCEALYIRAAVHMATGKHSGAKTDMDEFDRTRRSDPSLGEATLDAMHFALRAELALAAGQSDEAEFLVRDGLAAADQKRFLFVSSYWSYAALGDVAVRLLGANEGCSPARRSQLLILVRRALGVMAWFTHGVPVARPALLRIEAQYALLSGRKKKAAARLRLSAEAARGLGMPMEERRAQAEASGAGPASWAAGQESAGGEA